MRIQWFRRQSPARVARASCRPAWAWQPTVLLPRIESGRAGNLTPAQQWRANGGRP